MCIHLPLGHMDNDRVMTELCMYVHVHVYTCLEFGAGGRYECVLVVY